VLAVTPSAQDRVGEVLRMSSSDKDGELLAATAAIKRTLATAGLDIHFLADALCQPAPLAEANAQRAPHDTSHWRDGWPGADTTDWHSVACECEVHGDALNLREQKFVSDMVAWTWHSRPSERQRAWLLIILNKVCHG
jgi:hypothetical protein